MKVAIPGAGYAGLVTGGGIADGGAHVLYVDFDPLHIDKFNTAKF